MGGKIIPRIRLTSAKDLVEVEAELGKISVSKKHPVEYIKCNFRVKSIFPKITSRGSK